MKLNNTDYQFRKAKIEDLNKIINLYIEDELGQFREEINDSTMLKYNKAFHEIENDKNQNLIVIEYSGDIIGTCHLTIIPSLTLKGSRRLNIEAVHIRESFRNQGLGTLMFSEIKKFANNNGIKLLQLTTNKVRIRAKKFYEKLGFTASHEGMKLYL